jgi:hypothetical protein
VAIRQCRWLIAPSTQTMNQAGSRTSVNNEGAGFLFFLTYGRKQVVATSNRSDNG